MVAELSGISLSLMGIGGMGFLLLVSLIILLGCVILLENERFRFLLCGTAFLLVAFGILASGG